MTLQDRRSFIATLGGGVLALAGSARAAAAPLWVDGRRHLRRIGIQLYSVKRQAIADLPGTLAQLAKIGFKEIEFWGTHSKTPSEIRQILDHNGLTSPSVHIALPTSPDGFSKIFADAKTMGHQWITVASPPFTPATLDEWKRLAGVFNEAGARVKAAGFHFAYHNHTEPFTRIGDIVPYELLVRETDPSLVSFEVDVHWAYTGGADAVDLLRKFPKRIKMLHLKDSSGTPHYTQADVGAGTYPWAKILDAAAKARVQHYFVEHDNPPDEMAFAKTSHDYLAKLEF